MVGRLVGRKVSWLLGQSVGWKEKRPDTGLWRHQCYRVEQVQVLSRVADCYQSNQIEREFCKTKSLICK